MLTEIQGLRDELRTCVVGLDVDRIDGVAARNLVVVFAEMERIASAGKMLAMGRVDATGSWANTGAKSPADWLSNVAGTGIGPAIETVAVARSIEKLPETELSIRQGILSLPQASAVTRAAIKVPGEEQRLLRAAHRGGLTEVKRESARVLAAARSSEEEAERARRQRAARSLTFWVDDEGMTCGKFRLEPTAGIVFRRRIEAAAKKIFDTARKQGVRDTQENYAADALIAHITSPQPAGESTSEMPVVAKPTDNIDVVVVIDFEALLRGELRDGERCEIPGIGPIPVVQAREYLLGGAFLKVLIAKGIDIRTVCHYGRNIPAELKTALTYRDPTCVIAGCHRTKGLERHHVVAVASNGQTSIFNLRRVCSHDHDLVTHHGYTLSPTNEHGKCQLIPPKPQPPS